MPISQNHTQEKLAGLIRRSKQPSWFIKPTRLFRTTFSMALPGVGEWNHQVICEPGRIFSGVRQWHHHYRRSATESAPPFHSFARSILQDCFAGLIRQINSQDSGLIRRINFPDQIRRIQIAGISISLRVLRINVEKKLSCQPILRPSPANKSCEINLQEWISLQDFYRRISSHNQ